VESNIFVLAWSLLAIYQFFILIEPVWRPIETIKFFVIVQLLTPFLISIIGILSFAAFESLNFYFSGIICGYSSLCVAVFVAIKQFLPDTVVLATPFGRVKNTHLPGISVFFASILWIFGLVRGTVPLQIMFGIQISWTYLRYYQTHDETDEIGDSSEHFSWATLFPRRTQPLAIILGKIIFRTLVRLHICKRKRHVDLNQLPTVNVVLPGLDNRDSERRRQKALRDLNERLSRAKKVQSSPDLPDMEDMPTGIVATSPVSATHDDVNRVMFYSGARDSESPSDLSHNIT
jgi:hypothetical protein